MKLTADKEARFWAKVNKTADCWLWTAATDPYGYGRFTGMGGTLRCAHRVSFELSGQSIPNGMVIDHVCRNRSCVNPLHLRAVDRLTNVHENSNAPGHLNSLKTHCPQGHAYDAGNLVTAQGRRRCRECLNASQRRRRQRNRLDP